MFIGSGYYIDLADVRIEKHKIVKKEITGFNNNTDHILRRISKKLLLKESLKKVDRHVNFVQVPFIIYDTLLSKP